MGRSRYRSVQKLDSRDPQRKPRPVARRNSFLGPENTTEYIPRRRYLPIRSHAAWQKCGLQEPTTTSTEPLGDSSWLSKLADANAFGNTDAALPLPLSQFAAAFPLPTGDDEAFVSGDDENPADDDADDAALFSPGDDDNPGEPLLPGIVQPHDMESAVRVGLRVWKASGSLLSVLLTRGKNPLTRLHYELIIRLLRPYMDTPGGSHLPAFSTLGRTIFPYIDKHCLPRLRYIHSEEDPVDALPTSENSPLIYPSTWALYDARCYSFSRCVYDTARREDRFSFNNSPFIADRARVLDETQVLHIPYQSRTQFHGGRSS